MTWLSDVSGASCRSQKKGLGPTNESRFSLLKSILSLELRGSAPAQPSSERFPDSSIKLSQAWSPKRASVGSAASMRRHSPFRRRCQSCAATRTYAAVVNRAPPLAPPPPLSIVRSHSPLRRRCQSCAATRPSALPLAPPRLFFACPATFIDIQSRAATRQRSCMPAGAPFRCACRRCSPKRAPQMRHLHRHGPPLQRRLDIPHRWSC